MYRRRGRYTGVGVNTCKAEDEGNGRVRARRVVTGRVTSCDYVVGVNICTE